jgi:hypothetical protein
MQRFAGWSLNSLPTFGLRFGQSQFNGGWSTGSLPAF